MTETPTGAVDPESIPLHRRPIPDRLDYFSTRLAEQIDFKKLPHDAIIAIAAAVINLGTMATETRALQAEREQLTARVAQLETVLAEEYQRDRVLALLLLRLGGRVELTEAERVAAPRVGEFVSHENPVTRSLEVAFVAAEAPQARAQNHKSPDNDAGQEAET